MDPLEKLTYQNQYRYDFVTESYETIAHRTLTDSLQLNLVISGALLHHNIFKKICFQNCIFFGSQILNCQFIGCKFINCKFEFTLIEECNFLGCHFNNVTWPTGQIKICSFNNCMLEAINGPDIEIGENEIKNCFQNPNVVPKPVPKTAHINKATFIETTEKTRSMIIRVNHHNNNQYKIQYKS